MIREKYLLLILGLLSLALAWNYSFLTPLIFVGFVPLLYVLQQQEASFALNFRTAYIYVLFWQLASTFWLFRTNVFNVVLLNFLNSLLPALIITVAVSISRWRKTSWLGYLTLLLAWISMEFAQHRGELAFPLLTLGNVLGDWPLIVQWYAWTGVLGGSIWILATNFIFTEILLSSSKTLSLINRSLVWKIAVVVSPVFLSLTIFFFSPVNTTKMTQIVSVHPNLDCYTEKYDLSAEEVVRRHLKLSLKAVTPQTEYLIWPETAVPDGGWTTTVDQDPLWLELHEKLIMTYPKLKLVTGAVMYQPLATKTTPSDPLVHYHEGTQSYFRTYNSAIQLQAGTPFQMRTKQQLVAFEETLPYAESLSFLDGLVPSLGNFAFSAAHNNQHVFSSGSGAKVTPLICYETAFGEVAASYVRKGAELLMVILNEGWYQNKYGARQFMRLSRIRAIETRRSVARSSNFGASGFIDPYGRIIEATSDFKATTLKSELPMRNGLTFYVQYGDYLGRLFVLVLIGHSLVLGWHYFFFKEKEHN
jgi:apolipoprotein N-acyltransferase